MLKKLSRRDRIAVIIGVVGAALFALLDFGILPLLDRVSVSPEVIQQREVEFRRTRRLLANAKVETAHFNAAQADLKALETGLLESSSPFLANAEWQRMVGQMADSKGIQIGSSEFLRTQELGSGYSLVTGRVNFRCQLVQLVDFMVLLASSPKLLSVTGLTVFATRTDTQETLNVQLTIGAVARTMKPANDQRAGNGKN
jgi:hypothetical protein